MINRNICLCRKSMIYICSPFRQALKCAAGPEGPSLTSPVWGTLKASPSGSWRKSWPGILSTIRGAVRSGSWWSESAGCTERPRRTGNHVSINTHVALQKCPWSLTKVMQTHCKVLLWAELLFLAVENVSRTVTTGKTSCCFCTATDVSIGRHILFLTIETQFLFRFWQYYIL